MLQCIIHYFLPLNHPHHRKFDYCIISSVFLYLPIVFSLCNMLTGCQRVNKHINDQIPIDSA